MVALIKSHIKRQFNDRVNMFFSYLTVIIVVVSTSLVFDRWIVRMLLERIPQLPEAEALWMVRCWVLGGLLSISPVSTAFSMVGILVFDRENKAMKGIYALPGNKWIYPFSILIAAWIHGALMTIPVFAGYALYIIATVGQGFSLSQVMRALIWVCLTSFSASCMSCFLLRKCQETSVFAKTSTILGINIGFNNTGYVPIGIYPWIFGIIPKLFPFWGVTVMLRQALMEAPVQNCATMIGAASEAVLKSFMGLDCDIGSLHIPERMSLLYMIIISAVSLILFLRSYDTQRESYVRKASSDR